MKNLCCEELVQQLCVNSLCIVPQVDQRSQSAAYRTVTSQLHKNPSEDPVLDPEDRNAKNDKNDKPQAGPKINK